MLYTEVFLNELVKADPAAMQLRKQTCKLYTTTSSSTSQ